jgi:D-alanyl-D-alanine carboxypeptidase
MHLPSKFNVPATVLGIALAATAPRPVAAEALLLVETDSGKVLQADNATYPWYPASVTKLMTAYVTLRAVKERRIALDKAVTVSSNAAAQQPSKMGFKPGTLVTIDNALKMLMVKSANDMAVVLAEGVSGSIEKFADEMNAAAQRLGMTQTSYVNPNGLPADGQVTSARDLAILARALIREFPEYDVYWHIPAIKFGKRIMRNYNTLIDRYPGADGMKTGFICASGFNLVATATRDNRRLIAVVLGAPSSAVRAAKAAALLEHGFTNTGGLSWLMPSLGTVDGLTPINAAPPNLREEMCGKHRRRPAAEEADEEDTPAAQSSEGGEIGSQHTFMLSSLKNSVPKPSSLIGPLVPSGPPVEVYVGAARRPPGTAVAAAPAKPEPRAAKPPADNAGKPTAAAIGLLRWPGNAAATQVAAPAPALVPMPRPRPHSAKPKHTAAEPAAQ